MVPGNKDLFHQIIYFRDSCLKDFSDQFFGEGKNSSLQASLYILHTRGINTVAVIYFIHPLCSPTNKSPDLRDEPWRQSCECILYDVVSHLSLSSRVSHLSNSFNFPFFHSSYEGFIQCYRESVFSLSALLIKLGGWCRFLHIRVASDKLVS